MDVEQKIEQGVEAAAKHFGKDKLMHAAMGLATVLAVLLVLAIAKHDIGFSLAVATTMVGLANEWQQKYRGIGEFSPLDAAATAAPGYVAWGVLALIGLH